MPELIYGGDVHVERENGDFETLTIPENFIERLIDEDKKMLFLYRCPFVITLVPEDSHNKDIGLQKKDIIVSLNGQEIKYFDQFPKIAEDYKGQEVDLGIERGGARQLLRATISEDGKLGVAYGLIGLSDL